MSRIVDGSKNKDDIEEISLRPQLLKEYVGQKELKDNLEVFIGAAPAANTNRDEVVLIAAPEVMYDERLRNLSDYFNVAGKAVRGYRFRSGNMFAVTAEALDGSFNASNAKGKIVELQASTKMKVVASLTSGSTQVGTIEAVEVAGPYTYFVIKVK